MFIMSSLRSGAVITKYGGVEVVDGSADLFWTVVLHALISLMAA